MISVPSASLSALRGLRTTASVDCNELLDRLPLSNEGDLDQKNAQLRARELAIESREADVAEWEQLLAGMEVDLRNREALLNRRIEDESRRTKSQNETTRPEPPRGTEGKAHVSQRSGKRATAAVNSDLAAQLDRKVDLMNDLLKELMASQTENLAERQTLDEKAKDAERRDLELDRLEESLSNATSDVVSARVTVSAQQDELESQRDLVRNELQRLQADRDAFDSDRQQVQQLLEALREERAALQREREQYLLDCGPSPVLPADQNDGASPGATAEEAAASAEAQASSLSEAISTELKTDSDHFNRLFAKPRETPAPVIPPTTVVNAPSANEFELHDCDQNSIAEYMDRLLHRARRGKSDVVIHAPVKRERPAPTPAPSPAPAPAPTAAPPASEQVPSAVEAPIEIPQPRARPRQNTQEIREGINQLRQVANQSAQQALSRYFWKRHRSAFTLKLMLVIMSFSLAAVLSMDHGVKTTSFSAVAWGAAAIGLITASNLVHTLTELGRLNARFQQESSDKLAQQQSKTSS